MLGCTQQSVSTPGGRQSPPRTAGFKVRDTWIHPPKHMQGPDKGSGKAAGQRHSGGQRSLARLLGPIPHPLPFPGLDPPFYPRVWQMEVLGIPPLQTSQPHPLTLLLKEPEERREVAAQEHHHDCGCHRPYPNLCKTPGDAFTTTQR